MFFRAADQGLRQDAAIQRWADQDGHQRRAAAALCGPLRTGSSPIGRLDHLTVKDERGLVVDQREDPELRHDPATGHWKVSQPIGTSSIAVIRGHGPLNKERVGLRRFSYEQGQWVRRRCAGQHGNCHRGSLAAGRRPPGLRPPLNSKRKKHRVATA